MQGTSTHHKKVCQNFTDRKVGEHISGSKLITREIAEILHLKFSAKNVLKQSLQTQHKISAPLASII